MDNRDLNLARMNRELEQIFQLAPIPLCVLDRDFRYVRINARMAQVNNRPQAEHLGRSVDEIVPTLAERIKADVRAIMGGGQPERDHLFSGPIPELPASTGDWLASYYPLHDEDGSVRGVIVVLADVTQLRRIERALQRSEQRFQTALRAGNLGVWDCDPRTGRCFFSDQYWRMLGYEPGELPSEPDTYFRLLHPEDSASVRAAWETHLRGESPQLTIEFRLRHKDGSWRWIRSEGRVECAADGGPLSVSGVHIDITDRKQGEAFLREAKRAAEQANAAKRQFVASISHEMRTPLTAIVGFTELLSGRNLSAEQRLEYLDAAQRNARNLLSLIDNVLDFSKIEAGKMEIILRDCSLWQILRDVRSATAPAAEKKGLRLDLDYRYPLPDVICTDALRLWQILVNLVNNAIKYTEHGGVRVAVGLEAAEAGGNGLRLTVSDTGPGLPPEFLEQAFEPFTQAEASLVRSGGVGLGLPIAARLAELLGTRLEFVPSAAGGTTFSFTLDVGPLAERRLLWGPPEPDARGSGAKAGGERLQGRLLLAEDSVDIQRLLRIYLESAGLQVDVANDGLSAVRAAMSALTAGRPYDAILLDLQMPELDGYDAARLLRASGWTNPILAISAHITAEHQERCRDVGIDEFLPKPVTREALLSTLRRHLPGPAPGAGPRTAAGDAADDAAQLAPAGDRLAVDVRGLLAVFADQLSHRLALLDQRLQDQDRTRLGQTAHQLAGAAGLFGFPELAFHARSLEQRAADQAPWSELASLLAAVRAAAPTDLSASLPAAAKPPAGAAAKRCRVLLADDDTLVRAALRLMVDGLPGFEVVAEAATGRETLAQVQQHQPDIVLMDIAMPELDGLGATARVAAVAPHTKVIILSAQVRRETVSQALQAGAAGFLSKDADPEALDQALRAVTRGETYYEDVVSQHLR